MGTPPPSPTTPTSSPAPPPDRSGDAFDAYVVDADGDGIEAGVRRMAPGDLGEGDVLIDVAWSAINYKDGMVTRPGNRVARRSPLVPGVDLVGTVAAVDDPSVGAGGGVALAVGQPVIAHGYDLGVAHHGGFAQRARVPASWVVPLPEGLTMRQAATIGTAGFTAALSLTRLEHHGLAPGDGQVLVTGASGGVGSMAVSLLSEHAYLTRLGASEVVDRDALTGAPGRTLDKERWAGAVDCVGGATLSAVLRALRYGAAVAASGLTGGSTFESSVFPFIVRNASLIGVDTVETPIDERRRVWSTMATSFPADLLEEMVDQELGLDGLGPALARILDGRARGRMLVDPGR
jgi:putative YhdH/YhfP family quinone oxidoreductase